MDQAITIILTILGTLTFVIMLFNMKSPGKRVEHLISREGSLDSPVVMRSIGQLLGPPLVGGNLITPLHNGDEIFPAMLDAIKSARITITFETFIFWTGEIGKQLSEALIERAKSGVQVNMLIDWMGSRNFDEDLIAQMRASGIRVLHYRPLRWYNLMRINNRTHRKILVIDGRIGFTGGVGIADQWLGHAEDKDHWRDSHFKVEGPVVSQLQSAFSDNWNAMHSEVPHGDRFFPELTSRGEACAQVFKSSPEEGSGSVRLMYLYSIAHASKSILIANSYFVPDTHVRAMIIDARRRGVNVEVIVPGGKIDTPITRRASRAVWGDLLAAGVKIYEYQPTMFHCKYMVVDELWVSVGSTNLDNRSFRLNDECNLNIIDRGTAKKIVETFLLDRASSKEMTFAQWQNRPLIDKIVEKVSHLFRSQV